MRLLKDTGMFGELATKYEVLKYSRMQPNYLSSGTTSLSTKKSNEAIF